MRYLSRRARRQLGAMRPIGPETGRAELRKILVVTIAAALVLGGVGTAALLTDSATGGVAWSTTAKTTTGTTTTTGGATTTVTVTLPTTVAVTTTGPSQTVTVPGPSTTVTTPGRTKVVKRTRVVSRSTSSHTGGRRRRVETGLALCRACANEASRLWRARNPRSCRQGERAEAYAV